MSIIPDPFPVSVNPKADDNAATSIIDAFVVDSAS